MLSLVVWGSLLSLPFLLGLSFVLEVDYWKVETFRHLSWLSIGSIAYLVYPVTLFGFAIWSFLLSRYPATTVAPFTLLVPVFGFSSSALLVGEALPSWKLIAAFLIVSGLIINLYGERFLKKEK